MFSPKHVFSQKPLTFSLGVLRAFSGQGEGVGQANSYSQASWGGESGSGGARTPRLPPSCCSLYIWASTFQFCLQSIVPLQGIFLSDSHFGEVSVEEGHATHWV